MIPSFRCYVLDLDGVVYLGCEPVPGAVEAVRYLQERARVMVLTNNSTLSRQAYRERLRGLGIRIAKEDIITSGYAAAVYVKERFPGARVYVVGEEGLKEEMAGQGLELAAEDCDVVVAGMDRQVSYGKMAAALRFIREGAAFVATNLDRTLITEDGVLPGGGCIVKAIEYAAGVEPVVAGKPTEIMARVLLEAAGERPEDILIIGDRLTTDIAMGRTAGTRTALVLTGDDSLEDLEGSPIRPDYVLESLADLVAG
ncbi:MAG: HAD-IIA family hydrolase [Euryarchaeota archaeon]|nr:HAD-IIA family hydrolase [Euryarchaeota archaeon]